MKYVRTNIIIILAFYQSMTANQCQDFDNIFTEVELKMNENE